MSTSDSPPPATNDQGAGLQFSVRSLLFLTACCAVAIWLWPLDRDDPIELQIVLGLLVTAFIVTIFLVPSAWRRMALRKHSGIEAREHRFERFAFICGILGLAPYGALALMVYFDPFEHGSHALSSSMVALFLIGIYSWIPVVLLLAGSLMLFFGHRRNLPLFLLRLLGLVANLGLVLVFLIASSSI